MSGDTDLPKVFVEETYMGGYNDLKAAILSGQFKFITRDRCDSAPIKHFKISVLFEVLKCLYTL
jgi:hypothetical protein